MPYRRRGPRGLPEFIKLHPGQQAIFDDLFVNRLNIIRCGRRFGKTTLLETTFGSRAVEKHHTIGWFTPDYKLMKPSFQRLRRALGDAVLYANATDYKIELVGGGEIEFWTLDNPDAGRSRAYDDVVIDEASLKAKGLEEIIELAIMPTLVDRDGTLTMAGTPKGVDPENFFYLACTQKKKFHFREFHAPTWMNPHLSQTAVARLEKRNPPLVYQQEYCAEFVDWSGAAFFSLDSLTIDGKPVQPPYVCDTIVAFMDTATKTGKEHDGTGVVIAAYNKWPAPRLVILDWDLVQIEGSLLEMWLPNVIKKCQAYAQQCHARAGFQGVYIEDKASGMILLQQGYRRGFPVRPIDSKTTAMGKEERAFNISGYVWNNQVKLAENAFTKEVNYKGDTANHFRRQVVGYRVGNKEQIEDDLLDAFCYSVSLTCGDSAGF